MKAIEIKGLTKKYGKKIAVDNISLDIDKGSLFALLGVNGAGKTTLIKMLNGITAPTSGDALVCGSSIVFDIDKVKEITNISPQETAVAPNLTVRENIELMAGIYGRPASDADELIERLKLAEYENSLAKTLSGGWQRRLSIALALISSPQVLFLDEPTLGLDIIARRELWEFIRSLKGTTIILTTHYLEEALALADTVAVMVEGRLAALGTEAQIVESVGAKDFEDAFIRLAAGEVAR